MAVQAGQKDHRNVARERRRLEPTAQAVTVGHRHHDVEQDQVGLAAGLEVVDQRLTLAESRQRVVVAQIVFKHQQVVRLVIDGDHTILHC
jgi:hypothetical protein